MTSSLIIHKSPESLIKKKNWKLGGINKNKLSRSIQAELFKSPTRLLIWFPDESWVVSTEEAISYFG